MYSMSFRNNGAVVMSMEQCRRFLPGTWIVLYILHWIELGHVEDLKFTLAVQQCWSHLLKRLFIIQLLGACGTWIAARLDFDGCDNVKPSAYLLFCGCPWLFCVVIKTSFMWCAELLSFCFAAQAKVKLMAWLLQMRVSRCISSVIAVTISFWFYRPRGESSSVERLTMQLDDCHQRAVSLLLVFSAFCTRMDMCSRSDSNSVTFLSK